MKTYIARQPVFNAKLDVYGYELLYRDSDTNAYNPDMDGNQATRAVLSAAATTFGMRNIADDRAAFINFSEKLLMSQSPLLLSPKELTIEILESVEPSDVLIERLYKLKELGYTLALDDYDMSSRYDRIVEVVDIVKVDFHIVKGISRTELPGHPKFRGKILLAEKVETKEEYQQAKYDGYQLFQGFFFAKPTVFSKKKFELAASTYMRVLRKIRMPHFSYDEIASIIRLDVNLTYKLLYRVNTLNYYRRYRVTSIKQALVRMGVVEVQRWLMLILMQENTNVGTMEFAKTALIRGVFSGKIAEELGLNEMDQEDAFITGMFSLIDSAVEEDFIDILDSISISPKIEQALLGEENVYKMILDFAKAYEQGEWDQINKFSEQSGIAGSVIAEKFMDSIRYADIAFCDNISYLPPADIDL